jgi:hypothetical protein
VYRSLLEEGFELGVGLPNLQLAGEVREAIGWSMENRGFSQEWDSLKLFLEWAEHRGVLLDLNPTPDHWPATA